MRRTVFALIVMLSLIAAIPAAPVLGLSPTACRVKNTDTGVTKRNLHAAVRAARKGHRLTVRGVCHGTTSIAKDHLTIVGIRPKGAAFPTLDGDQRGSVVTIAYAKNVVLGRLRITDGSGESCGGSGQTCGGGITNRGLLTLWSVRVVGNTATHGGGIHNILGYRYPPKGTVTMRGRSRISGNTGTSSGGGVNNGGIFILRDTSAINGNTAGTGGGVINGRTLILRDASRISGNTASGDGGGVYNASTMTLYGSSQISDNHAAGDGGGVYNDVTLNVRAASQISGNTTDSRGGGVFNIGAALNVAGSSQITGNTAPADQGGGVRIGNSLGTFDASQCGPGKPVHDNIGGDCAP